MEAKPDYAYTAYNDPAVKQVRIPQAEWAAGHHRSARAGLHVARGVVHAFDVATGNGTIIREGDGAAVFFNFTAIPGHGYRKIRPDTDRTVRGRETARMASPPAIFSRYREK